MSLENCTPAFIAPAASPLPAETSSGPCRLWFGKERPDFKRPSLLLTWNAWYFNGRRILLSRWLLPTTSPWAGWLNTFPCTVSFLLTLMSFLLHFTFLTDLCVSLLLAYGGHVDCSLRAAVVVVPPAAGLPLATWTPCSGLLWISERREGWGKGISCLFGVLCMLRILWNRVKEDMLSSFLLYLYGKLDYPFGTYRVCLFDSWLSLDLSVPVISVSL